MNTTAKHFVLVLICCFLQPRPCRSGVIGDINRDCIIVVNAEPPVDAYGLSLTSTGGNLVPLDPADPAPFTFLLSNTRNEVTWATLGTPVSLGHFNTGVVYSGPPGVHDISAVWGDGPTPVAFPVGSLARGIRCTTGTADFNLDNVVDLFDIDLLGMEIAAETNNDPFDLNGDQLVNQDDLIAFLGGDIITDGNKLNGDADFSGTVAFADFLVLSANFGKDGRKWSEGDFIANGRVEFDDFLTLSANFGKTADSVTQIPEAHTAVDLSSASYITGRANTSVQGWEFVALANIIVTDVGWLDHEDNGLTTAHEVGIFNDAGDLLTSGTVPSGTKSPLQNEFRYVAVDPTLLSAGSTYVIGGTTEAFQDEFRASAANVSYDAIDLTAARAEFGATSLVFPTSSFTSKAPGVFGPNFLFVPEPAP